MSIALHRTRFVTFPRSGHHWLIAMLQQALPDLRYDEHYTTGRTLESAPEINAQKTHDFSLVVPTSDEYQHVVQYRSDLDAVIRSWHRIAINPDAFPVFERYARDFNAAWTAKWIDADVPNRLIVRYEDMVADTDAVVQRVIAFITE